MSRAVFVDTSAWLAALSTREALHQECVTHFERLVADGVALVTTTFVVAELHALFVRRRGAREGVRLLELLHNEPQFELVEITRELRKRAIEEWLKKFRDVPLSLTDAVSFEVMRERDVGVAFALDRHFVLAGFTCVPSQKAR